MAKKSYTRFSIQEREILYKYLTLGTKQNKISKILNRDPSTISREIHRDGMDRKTYCPSIALEHQNQEKIRRRRKHKLLCSKTLCSFVEASLLIQWSPEQISGYLKVNPQLGFQITPETIYRHIYSIEDKDRKALLISMLRQRQKRRRTKLGRRTKRTRIRNLVPISQRPTSVEGRKEVGHWEGDLVIGKDHKSAIGTLIERKTRFTLIVNFEGTPNSKDVILGFAAKLALLPPHMKRRLNSIF